MGQHKLPLQQEPKSSGKLLDRGGEILKHSAFNRNLPKLKLGGGSHNTYSGPPKRNKK